jgi:hypothetical protein
MFHKAINNLLFLAGIILQTVTGLKPVIYKEPKYKVKIEKGFRLKPKFFK